MAKIIKFFHSMFGNELMYVTAYDGSYTFTKNKRTGKTKLINHKRR